MNLFTRLIISWLLFQLPIFLLGQTVSILFQVDMSYQIQQGKFTPTNEFVDVAGTFNNWGGNLSKLTDTNNDKIYEITLAGFTAGTAIEFKFRQNGKWDGSEEFPGGGSNRKYTVKAENNTILVWYSDEVSPTAAPVANFNAGITTVYSNSLITFKNTSAGNISTRKWIFEGGIPAISDEIEPIVFYEQAGNYKVTLIVSGSNGSDTLSILDYINVTERSTDEVEWWNQTVFYEIFVRSFYDSNGDGIGDFKGLTQKLDYLNDGNPNTSNDLGITGIWLMPIHPSPSYHGYDATDYRGIHPQFGTMDDFKAFLKAAHDRGIKVIIDYVMNHTSNQHPWFQNALASSNATKRNWYRWSVNKPNYNGPWGQQVWHNSNSGFYYGVFFSGMPDLNYQEPTVKTEMFDIADFWLKEIGVDGFRLDAVKYIVEENVQLEDTKATFTFFQDFRKHYKMTQPNAFTVGEAWTSTDKVLPYVKDDGIDFCFEFDVSYAIQNAINQGNAKGLAEQLQKSYNVYPNLQFGTFLSNHDQDRIMNVFGNNSDKLKAAASIYLTAPGVPFLYYGEEIGMNGQKPDEFIRRPMQWTSDRNAGFTTGTPWIALNNNFTTFNVASQASAQNSIWNHYKSLISIRNQEVVLRNGNFATLASTSGAALAFLRSSADGAILVIVNTSNMPITNVSLNASFTGLSTGSYVAKDLLNGGNILLELANNGFFNELTLNAYETKIYKIEKSTSILATNPDERWIAYPNPAKEQLNILADKPLSGNFHYAIIDGLGRVVQTGYQPFVQQVSLAVGELQSGFYVLKGTIGQQEIVVKFYKH